MAHGEVSGLKNRESVMAGVLGGDYKDRMADRLPRSYKLSERFLTVFGSG